MIVVLAELLIVLVALISLGRTLTAWEQKVRNEGMCRHGRLRRMDGLQKKQQSQFQSSDSKENQAFPPTWKLL